MKHFTIPAPFAISSKQAQATLIVNECVAAGGAFEDLTVETFCTMGIKETHEIKRNALTCTYWTRLSNILLRTIIDRSHISRAHIRFLRLPPSLVQADLAFNEADKSKAELCLVNQYSLKSYRELTK
jgi:hypothetical protein